MLTGFIYAALASIIYGIEPSITEIIINKGANEIEICFICLFLTSIIALLSCLFSKVSLKISLKGLLLSIAGGLLYYLTNLSLSFAYGYIPVGLVTLIHFTYPPIVFLVCTFFFKEKASINKILGLLFCLTGLFLIGDTVSTTSVKGPLIALCSAIFYASFMLLSDKTYVSKLNSNVFTFYMALSGSLVPFVLTKLTRGNLVTPIPLLKEVFPIMVVVAVMLFLAVYLLNKSIQLIGANRSSSFTVIEPLTSLIVSSLIFHYSFSLACILGSLFILLSLYLSFK